MTRRGVLLALVALCCVTLALGWWTKAHCLTDGAWTDGEQYASWCYTDVFPLWFEERLDEGAVPYLDHPVEYPVLTGAQMWLAAEVAEAVAPGRGAVAFFHVTAVIGAAAALGTLVVLSAGGLPARRLLWWAAAPTLVLYAFMNWDPVPILCFVAGLVAHWRGRDAWAGVFAGLGVAAKLMPGLLVPLVVATRLAQGRARAAAAHAGAAAGTWLALNVPVVLASPEGWWEFVRLNQSRPADWDSLWFMAEQIAGQSLPVPILNAASAVVFLAGAAVIAVVGSGWRPKERWWELALPLFAWFLLTNKVYSPQFSLWVVPLMAVALPRWPAFAAFLVADTAVFGIRFLYLGGIEGLEPAPAYPVFAAALLVRAGVLLWVIGASVRQPGGVPVSLRRSAAPP